jgi:glycerol-3-phosphate dehydrogenase (NAD(P)+)
MREEPGLRHVGVIGAGAFGTALAQACIRAGRRVTLWARDPAQVAAMRTDGTNRRAALGRGIAPTAALEEAAAADVLVLATPTQSLREVASRLAGVTAAGKPVVIAAKGIEKASGRFVSEIVEQAMDEPVAAVLSGPGFAEDIGRGAPTALTLACAKEDAGRALVAALGSPTFRLYGSTDMRGVEIGGAAKNVIAIAAGVAAGKGFGESSVAALIARGFAELVRFGAAYGARPETLAGLSGLGDLILTGTSSRSRNRRLGEAIGAGSAPQEAIASIGLAEGAWTAGILVAMARARAIEMPVCEAVAELVDGRRTVGEAIEVLLARPPRREG